MNNKFLLQSRLVGMNFLEFAVWGAYLTSMGNYLGSVGLGDYTFWFYAVQGIVSIFMPGLMGIVADKWVPAERLLGLCHFLAALFMASAGYYGMTTPEPDFVTIFSLYTLSVAFFMPTIALSNSVAFTGLTQANMDTVKDFPPIRVFGTVGFICSMWATDLLGFKSTYEQFYSSAFLGFILAAYAPTLPKCPINKEGGKKTIAQALGLDAFKLFKQKRMAIFFIFSMLLGVSLQITNSYATPFISSFAVDEVYKETFGVQHSVILYSLSQISEACCILLIPFFLRRYGIKRVMMMAMAAWIFRFGLFGFGNPGPGVWMFILSMIVYGLAFDFFNISGALFVDQNTDGNIRNSAQGLFMIMTNGLGASLGMMAAGAIVNHFTTWEQFGSDKFQVGNWSAVWLIFATYALIVFVLFTIFFKEQRSATK
ncbi:MAG: MFS transporter [Alloprevotella sp.]|nr:MFS transporter [Alloprevotella sp.]